MSDDEEYEVEFIQEARVDKAKGKNSKPLWQFLVRWKGFGPDEDTWEPMDSFEESQQIINDFWTRCKDPRDIRDIKQFSVGDKFLPRGPPPRKPKRKSTGHAETSSRVAEPSHATVPSTPEDTPTLLDISDIPTGKRRRGLTDGPLPDKPRKRQREATSSISNGKKSARNIEYKAKPEVLSSRQRGKSRRKPQDPSPEIIPDSDEEVEQAMKLDKDFDSQASLSVHGVDNGPSPPTSASPAHKSTFGPLFDEDSDHQIPSHRLRTKKPLVKQYEDPALVKPVGQLSAKTRAAAPKRSEPVPSSSGQRLSASVKLRQRPGPGRSSFGLTNKKSVASLLTGTKGGALKTVKGSYHRPAEQALQPEESQQDSTLSPPAECIVLEEPPTAEELFALAGFDAEAADALPNFEDSEHAKPGTTKTNDDSAATDAQASALARERAENLNKAKESLFPTSSMSVDQPVPWNRPTIFGPLTAGKQSSPSLPMEADPDQPNHAPFSLNLDATTSVPVLFTNVVPGGSRLAPDIHVTHRSPPGQFYTSEASGSLLDAVRSLGIAGRVLVRSDAPTDLKQHFVRFSQRLKNGDLFIATAGIQLYAFCSSDSNFLCSRMNISPGLQVSEGQILVCKIVVDNFSGYAEVAGKADSRQWSQYVGSLA